jgi:hypothetical protein
MICSENRYPLFGIMLGRRASLSPGAFMKRGVRFYSAAALLAAGLAVGASWYIGSESAAPAPRHIGAPPADLPIEAVTIPSGSGSQLAGWFIPG